MHYHRQQMPVVPQLSSETVHRQYTSLDTPRTQFVIGLALLAIVTTPCMFNLNSTFNLSLDSYCTIQHPLNVIFYSLFLSRFSDHDAYSSTVFVNSVLRSRMLATASFPRGRWRGGLASWVSSKIFCTPLSTSLKGSVRTSSVNNLRLVLVAELGYAYAGC